MLRAGRLRVATVGGVRADGERQAAAHALPGDADRVVSTDDRLPTELVTGDETALYGVAQLLVILHAAFGGERPILRGRELASARPAPDGPYLDRNRHRVETGRRCRGLRQRVVTGREGAGKADPHEPVTAFVVFTVGRYLRNSVAVPEVVPDDPRRLLIGLERRDEAFEHGVEHGPHDRVRNHVRAPLITWASARAAGSGCTAWGAARARTGCRCGPLRQSRRCPWPWWGCRGPGASRSRRWFPFASSMTRPSAGDTWPWRTRRRTRTPGC